MFDSIVCSQFSDETDERKTSDSTLDLSDDEESIQVPDHPRRSSSQLRRSSSQLSRSSSQLSRSNSQLRRSSWQNFSTSFRCLSLDDEEDDDLLTLRNMAEFEDQILKYLKMNYLFVSLSDEQIINFAKKFEVVTYSVGDFITKQGEADCDCYFYVVVDGDCSIIKNGKRLPLIMPKGSSFGEQAILFGSSDQSASIVASKGSTDSEGRVVLYRLSR